MASDKIVSVIASLCVCSADAGKVAVATPVIQIVLVLVSTAAHGLSLYGDYAVWVHFQEDGFSDSPLIPPKTVWMTSWLAFTILRTLAAFAELVLAVLGCVNAVYMCQSRNRVMGFGSDVGASYKVRHCLIWGEEILGVFGVFFDVVLLLLGYFYYVVQVDCRDLNHNDKVIITISLTTASLLWHVVRFIIVLIRHFGCCGCIKAKEKWDDLIPVLVTNLACFKIILQPVLLVAGIVLLAFIVPLDSEVGSFDRGSIHVMRKTSDNYSMLFNITHMAMDDGANITVMEKHMGEDNTEVHCVVTFQYNSESHDFVYSFAYVDSNASSPSGQCTCTINHEKCQVHYEAEDLYYGHSSDGKPYECFNRAHLVGIYKNNSPTCDEDGEVHCMCPNMS